jgi:hypothetical protein
MLLATSDALRISLGYERTLRRAAKSDCAPTELLSKERTPGYKHLARRGEATNNRTGTWPPRASKGGQRPPLNRTPKESGN